MVINYSKKCTVKERTNLKSLFLPPPFRMGFVDLGRDSDVYFKVLRSSLSCGRYCLYLFIKDLVPMNLAKQACLRCADMIKYFVRFIRFRDRKIFHINGQTSVISFDYINLINIFLLLLLLLC